MLISKEIISDSPNVQPWWAIYTRHQHEKTIAEMLEYKGFEVFLPQYESLRRWKDRKKLLALPLFPCYVFLRGGLDRKLAVVSTPGVHMALSRGGKVAMIPDQEIDAIRRSVESSLRVEPFPFLNCGDRVRVKRGSLKGVEGVLVRKKNILRLVLSVDMLAKSVAVEIDGMDVERIDDGMRNVQGIAPSQRTDENLSRHFRLGAVSA